MKENRMKPKRSHKHPGPDWQGKGVNTGDKTTLGKASRLSRVSSLAQIRPFVGKVFYLDLQSNRTIETLESDIKELGGTVEKFFSKEIRYLVSNKREARYIHCLRQESPVPSPDSGPSSPHPNPKPEHPVNHVDKVKNRFQGQADTLVKSRGKSLVEKVVKGQGRLQMERILSNALEWGVKVVYVDDILAYVQKKKQHINSQVSAAAAAVKAKVKTESSAKQNVHKLKGGRISKPFVKVEDSSRHYRPIYLTMPNMPEFNLKTAAPCSPFCLEDKNPPGAKQQGLRGVKASANEEKAQGRKKNKDKKRGGYCECCMIKYNNFKMHLQSECHKAFSKTDEYSVVDRLVSTLHFSFIPIKTKVQSRPKCSVSSALFVPGPCGKTEISPQGGLNYLETAKEHRTADVSQGLDSGQKIKQESLRGSAPSICSKQERPKHRSLPSQWTCGQKSLTFGPQKAEQVKIPWLKSETPPSRGEFQTSFLPRDTQVNLVDQIPHKDTNSPPSVQKNIESEVSTKCINVRTQHEDTNKDESLHDSHMFSEMRNILSEKEETSHQTPDFSLVRRLQRKIKVYKHKRRKVDTHTERAESSDVPEKALLKLFELFQSSDDMDVEFYGFED